MEIYYNIDELEVGIDEVGRGCLAGPVVAAAVILPHEFEDETYKKIILVCYQCLTVEMSQRNRGKNDSFFFIT